jgi:hypothetical protein
MIPVSADENNKGTTRLPDVLSDPVWGPSRALNHTPFNKAHDFEGSLFDWYEGVRHDDIMLFYVLIQSYRRHLSEQYKAPVSAWA